MSETVERYRPRSLDNMLRGDSVSKLSERYTTCSDYDTLSLDRRIHGYREQSLGAMNMGYASDGEGRSVGAGLAASSHWDRLVVLVRGQRNTEILLCDGRL